MPTPLIRFRLTIGAEILLGLDDHALVQQSFPSFARISNLWCEASLSDLVIIQDDCHERSLNTVGGFEHTRDERAILGRASLSCKQAILDAHRRASEERTRTANNNQAFRELSIEGQRIIAAQKISEAQAARAAAAGRPTPEPVNPADLTIIRQERLPVLNFEVLDEA